MTIDAPDWERIVSTVLATGDVPDAPDWERIVVGSGGTPVGGGGETDWVPSDLGYSGWACHPYICNFSAAVFKPTNGVVYIILIRASKTTTLTSVVLNINGASSTPTTHASFLGIYTTGIVSGVQGQPQLLGSTAAGAMDAIMQANGFHNVALASGVNVTANTMYYGALLKNENANQMGVAQMALGFSVAGTGNSPFRYAHSYNLAAATLPGSLANPALTSDVTQVPWIAII